MRPSRLPEPLPSRLSVPTVALLLALAAPPGLAAPGVEAGQARWIHGSWVNVRTDAANDAPVAAHLVVNTPVHLIAQVGAGCQIRWGEGQQGFVACKLLGTEPVRWADTLRPTLADGAKPNPAYSPPRAFWLAPSMAALFAAGQYYQQTVLAPKQYALESGALAEGESTTNSARPPRLVRYALPEYDAMKAVLASGVVAPADLDPLPLSCRQMQRARTEQMGANAAPSGDADWRYPDWHYPGAQEYPYANPWVHACQLPGFDKLRLPVARPSFFVSAQGVLPGNAPIEQISARFGLIERGRVLGGPKWELDYDQWRYTGAWDIGRYTLSLDKPVVEHVIGRTGLVGAYQWQPSVTVTPNGPSARCDEGLRAQRMGKTLLPGYPAIKDALLWFQAPAALSPRTVKITSRVERPSSKVPEDRYSINKVAIYEVDMDGDGVADFVQWDVWSSPQITGPAALLAQRVVFINIKGEWYPFDIDGYQECT